MRPSQTDLRVMKPSATRKPVGQHDETAAPSNKRHSVTSSLRHPLPRRQQLLISSNSSSSSRPNWENQSPTTFSIRLRLQVQWRH